MGVVAPALFFCTIFIFFICLCINLDFFTYVCTKFYLEMRKRYPFIFMVSLLTLLQCHSPNRALHQKLVEMSQEINRSVPVMLDLYTRFDGASVTQDNVFQYRYSLLHTTNPDSLFKTRVCEIRENMIREFSSNPQLGIFKENRVVVSYCYFDEKGDTIQTLQITPEDYQ